MASRTRAIFCPRDLADDAGGQGRAGEGRAVEDGCRQAQGFGDLAHAVFTQLQQRLKNLIAEGLLRVDAELREHIVLTLDARHRLVDVGQDGALQQVTGLALRTSGRTHPYRMSG